MNYYAKNHYERILAENMIGISTASLDSSLPEISLLALAQSDRQAKVWHIKLLE